MVTLRELRLSRKLRIKDVAEYMGVTPRALHQWERGDRIISVYDLEKLMKLYESDLPISQISTLLPKPEQDGK